MPDAFSQIMDLWWLWLIFAVILIALVFVAKRYKGDRPPVFKEQPTHITVRKYLDDKFDIAGRSFGGHLYIGFHKIARIRKYLIVRGYFEDQQYDVKRREIIVGSAGAASKDGKPGKHRYDLCWMKAASNNALLRFFHIGDYYFLIKDQETIDEGKTRPCLNFSNENIFLPEGMDLFRVQKIWTNCHDGIQYITDISMARFNEQSMMHIENWPDLISHLNINMAMAERGAKRGVEMEKEKYKERESAGDTTITPIEA